MKQGKYYTPRRKHSAAKHPVAVLVSLALILLIGIGATIAYLQDETVSIENNFTPAEVPPTINEEFDGYVKENVTVTNKGNVKAYVRAAIVAIRKNADGIEAQTPAAGTDYSMSIGGNWVKSGEYYYCKGTLEAFEGTDTSSALITEAKQLQAGPDGYQLHIEIMVQTVQAEGIDSATNKTPVELAWDADAAAIVGTLGTTPPATEGGNE